MMSGHMRRLELRSNKRTERMDLDRQLGENQEHSHYRNMKSIELEGLRRRVEAQQQKLDKLEEKRKRMYADASEVTSMAEAESSRMAYIVADHDTRYLGRVGGYRPFEVQAEIKHLHENGLVLTRTGPYRGYRSFLRRDLYDLKKTNEDLDRRSLELWKKLF